MVFKFLFSVTGKLACIRFCGIFEWEFLQFLGISFDLGFFFWREPLEPREMASRLPNMTELLHALPEPHRRIEIKGIQKLEDGTTVERSYFFHISNEVAEAMPVPMLSKWTTGAHELLWNLSFVL